MEEKRSRIPKMKHDFVETWIPKLKNEFSKSPLASNACFGFILPFLEEDVEAEFECPCDDKKNAMFAAAYFIVPAVVAFLLSMTIQGYGKKKGSKNLGKTVGFSLFPPVLWIILLLMDGEVFACAMTTWSGSYEEMEKAGTKQWCKPTNQSQEIDYMAQIQDLFSLSQTIGMGFIILLACGFGVFIFFICSKREVNRDPESSELKSNEDMDGSGVIPLQDMKA